MKGSELFANLTAKTVLRDDKITLEVSGLELPSIVFSPEVNVAASLKNPEVSGGVSHTHTCKFIRYIRKFHIFIFKCKVVFEDRNFRGMGEKLHLLISKKEGKEDGTQDLEPTIKYVEHIQIRYRF